MIHRLERSVLFPSTRRTKTVNMKRYIHSKFPARPIQRCVQFSGEEARTIVPVQESMLNAVTEEHFSNSNCTKTLLLHCRLSCTVPLQACYLARNEVGFKLGERMFLLYRVLCVVSQKTVF
ncbi:hypothetical protein AVEN_195834-1 [Araneus ventricosus]|uniref:Uncharacterized protein n=1 Tax=Araneus ventricosus TaxID=182803 RepID=A0A4Y2F461_ARAVE|nr:hypothetical protein AVEN_195834-1 [Araneus ventricosus]